MASSRMATVVVVLLLLVCTLGLTRKSEAARMMMQIRGELLVAASEGNAADAGTGQDQDVAAPSSELGGDGAKREVPGGSDPIHHGSKPPASP
ncbi:hypothetical protein BRADI_1g38786v3 [Brachypodium distachyon]|uniref:Uncharacterized protein n=1 Tax=Brachypodium distachyon TaxID=15368 RepID=A0A2K2DNI5_BRADI|nr:hypothetical protein BRADI_1g38786v3 [Brachypodium distachyon]